MMLKNHLSKEQGLSDLLNYAHFIDDGVIVNKDGAFVLTYKFRGPDINSASGAELDLLTANFNRMCTFLNDGWMLHIDELRIPCLDYPEKGAFPDVVSALIDDSQRLRYQAVDAHYENFQFLTFVWKFPLPLVKTAKHWFVEGIEKEGDYQTLNTLLNQFYEVVDRCIGIIRAQFVLERLGSADLLSYLNICINGELQSISMPPDGCFLDVVLGRRNVVTGYLPRVGNQHINILSIIGYVNESTIPGLLEEMGTYPLVYRWSNRFIALSENTADHEIKRYQKNWNNKVKGLIGIVKEVISGKESTNIDNDAQQMFGQTTEAITLNKNNSVRFGYWTSEIVLMNENLSLLDQVSKDLTRYLEQTGFGCIKEEVNAFDAWLGTIPGHGSCNMRRNFINSITLAHVLPLHTIWAGEEYSSPSSLLPAKSPPVFYAATLGRTPFRFHLDVADVGHQAIWGPTGAGKSTYLGFLISQFLRYQDAQIFIFDKDYSHQGTTVALDGHHYDIGNAENLSFSPISDLSTASKRVRAEQYIEDLVSLQKVEITPDIRAEIHLAIEALSDEAHTESRNLTVLRSTVQNNAVRAAIKYYTIEGQIKQLDATHDSLQSGYLHTFETNWLLQQKPEVYIPILNHILDTIDSRLEEQHGKRPTLIIFEEWWFFDAHPVARRRLKDWLKTKRKQNARLILATQSLADAYDPGTKTLTDLAAVIMESCPTKIYLPNPTMENEIKELYRKIGLSERQLEIISSIAVPKKDYYIVTPEGNRLVDLNFNDEDSIALNFVGLSKKKSKDLTECKTQYGEEWVYHWLLKNNSKKWANYCKDNYYKRLAS